MFPVKASGASTKKVLPPRDESTPVRGAKDVRADFREKRAVDRNAARKGRLVGEHLTLLRAGWELLQKKPISRNLPLVSELGRGVRLTYYSIGDSEMLKLWLPKGTVLQRMKGERINELRVWLPNGGWVRLKFTSRGGVIAASVVGEQLKPLAPNRHGLRRATGRRPASDD